MRVNFSLAIVCAAVISLAPPISSQNRGLTVAPMPSPAYVPQLPYMAEYKTTYVQTLANGVTITSEFIETAALDSQGRWMTSMTTVSTSGNQTQITDVNVFDPVAQTSSIWIVPGKTATVVAMPTLDARRNCSTTVPAIGKPVHINQTSSDRPKPVIEDLGTETILGVEARGRRVITTIPAGTIGNNEPLVSTAEIWMAIAPGLSDLLVREENDDPQGGKRTKVLTNFTQAEPDASVFQPPEGYEIVNIPAPDSVCPS